MSVTDKTKNKAQEAVGRAKQATGGATGNKDLANEGRVDESKAQLKQAGEKAKDALDKLKDSFTE